MGFAGDSVVKYANASAEDAGLIPGSEANGNPLQSSCLGNPMDRRAWRATVHGVTKEMDTTQRLNNNNPKATEARNPSRI